MLLTLWLACSGVPVDSGDTDADSDTDADTDTDADSDTDTDSDTDADSDTDTDSDADSDTDTDTETLAVLTLNLHCFKVEGTSYADNDARFAAIADGVAALGVRAIAAQEACENASEGVAITRLADALAVATGQVWGTAWTPTHMAWTGTADEAQEGVGLLTAGGDPGDVEPYLYAVQGSQERWLLAGTLPGTSVVLTTVHLEHDDEVARRAQARQTAMYQLVRGGSEGIVAGDWNARAVDDAILDVEAAGFTRLSAGSDGDGSNIDHVFAASGADYTVVATRLVFDGASEPVVSDHPGVVVTLQRGAPDTAGVTRFVAVADVGVGHSLALRGNTSPLSWDLGWPAINTASDRWEAAFASWPSGEIAYKWLVDDSTWESGDDHTAAAGSAAEVTPTW